MDSVALRQYVSVYTLKWLKQQQWAVCVHTHIPYCTWCILSYVYVCSCLTNVQPVRCHQTWFDRLQTEFGICPDSLFDITSYAYITFWFNDAYSSARAHSHSRVVAYRSHDMCRRSLEENARQCSHIWAIHSRAPFINHESRIRAQYIENRTFLISLCSVAATPPTQTFTSQ